MSRFRLLRDFAALAFGEGISKVAGFVAFAYLARVLAPESYGAVELAAAMALFFALIVDFGFGPIGAREVARDPDRAADLAGLVPSARLLLAAIAIPLMGVSGLLLDQPRETEILIWWFALSLIANPFLQHWLLQGLDHMSWVSAAQAVRMLAFAGAVVLLVDAGNPLRVGVIEVGAAITMGSYFIIVQNRLVGRFRLNFDFRAMREMAREAAPMGCGQLVWSLNQYLPIVLVAVLLGGAEIAWFGGAHRVVLSLSAFVWLYHFNMYPTLARRAGDSQDAVLGLIGPSFRCAAWLSIGGALMGSLLAEPLTMAAFGERYVDAAPVFTLLVWVLPINLLSGHARFALIAAGFQRQELAAQLAGAVITLVVGIVAIPLVGRVGGSVSMLASGVVVWIIAHRFTVQRVAQIPSFEPIWRPAALALAVGFATTTFIPSEPSWLIGLVAGMLFAVAAPLIDRKLIEDFGLLAGAKGAHAENAAA